MGSKSFSTVTTDASYKSSDVFSTESSYQADTTNNNSNNSTTSIQVTESKELVSALTEASKTFAGIATNATTGLQAFAQQTAASGAAALEQAQAGGMALKQTTESDKKMLGVGAVVALIVVYLLLQQRRGKA